MKNRIFIYFSFLRFQEMQKSKQRRDRAKMLTLTQLCPGKGCWSWAIILLVPFGARVHFIVSSFRATTIAWGQKKSGKRVGGDRTFICEWNLLKIKFIGGDCWSFWGMKLSVSVVLSRGWLCTYLCKVEHSQVCSLMHYLSLLLHYTSEVDWFPQGYHGP